MAAPPLPVSPRQGDLVWGKLGRYPPWPGKIVPPPKDMTKPQGKKGYFVKFFGTENHAWIKVEHLKPYHAHKEEMTKTGKGKRFQQAVVSVDEYIKKVKARELAREQAKEQSSEDQKKSRPSSEKKSKKIAEKHKLVGKAKKNSGDLKKRILASDLKKFLASDLKKKILANELKKKVLAREMKKMLSDGIKKKSQSADGKKKVLASDGKKKIVKKILIANGKQKIVAKKSVPKKILPKKILAGASKKKTTSSGGKKIVSSDGKKRKILLADSKKKKIVLANGKSKNLSIEGKKKLLTGNKKKLSVEGKKKVLSGNGKKKILSDVRKKNMLLLSSKSQLKGLEKENSRKRGRPSKEPGASGSSTMKRMAMGTLAGFKWQSEYSEPVKDDPHFHHFLLSQTERLVTNRAISKRFKLSDDEMRSTSIQAADSTAANDIINPTDKMIGFLGLGLMGSGIVSNLLKMGHSVTVWNRTAEKCNLFVEEGAGLGRTPAEVVSNCDITFSCVADPQAARDLVLGPSGVLHGIRPGKCYVDLSTVDPETVVKVSREIVSRGGRFLEAPVSGNQQLSNEGMLVILAAGDQGLYEDCSSCFQAMGRASFFLGEVGSAAKMMLILSMMQGSFMATIAEGLTLAHITGQSQQTLLDILNQSPLASNFLDQKCQNILQGNFKPDSYLKYTQKDLRLAIALGDSVNLPTPMAAAANEVYKRAKALDQSDNDMSAVCRAYIH